MKKRLIPFAVIMACGLLIAWVPPTDKTAGAQSQSTGQSISSGASDSTSQTQPSNMQVGIATSNGVTSSTTSICDSRRTTGNGGTRRFCKGANVAGEIISLRNADGTWGQTWYRCKLPNAPRRGRVTSGVINYYGKEVNNLPLCSDTLASPTPRHPTGNGNWANFHVGDHVLGFAIEINLGSNGRTYFDCAMKSVSASGRVNSGVVNPSRFEIGQMTSCSNTNNWRPGFRTESGDSSLSFAQGDWVLAAYIVLDNGGVQHNGGPCHMVAPSSGTLYGGVRNYWPGEDNNLPAC